MKVVLLVVGKTNQSFVEDGLSFFQKRMKRLLEFSIEILPDVKSAGRLSALELMEKEAQLFQKRLQGQRYYMLDERGKQYTSLQLANFFEEHALHGQSNLIFCVGGAYGFSPTFKAEAQGKISLSSGTYTHQFIRLMFAEQVYRAMSIIHHLPYHNE